MKLRDLSDADIEEMKEDPTVFYEVIESLTSALKTIRSTAQRGLTENYYSAESALEDILDTKLD